MTQQPDEWPTLAEQREIAARIDPLIHFGTSTWTYPGWTGMVYANYSTKRAAADALAEYVRWPLFRTCGIDSFFYRPPDASMLQSYAAALPRGFRCVTKVWERITAHTFNSPREPERRGRRNLDWLNPQAFINEVLGPMQEHFSEHTGPFVFELEALPKASDGDDLPDVLDRFFGDVPVGPPYAVELRNAELLDERYFNALRAHNVAHVFNSWTRMPTIGEQLLMHESVTANVIVARALLRPGRRYAQAVDAFAPYDTIQDRNPALRNDLVALGRTAINLRIPAYVIVNNRAEGSAPLTIAAVAAKLTA